MEAHEMEIPDDLICLFSARIEKREDEPVITVPDTELEIGTLTAGDAYRVAIFAPADCPEPASESHADPAAQAAPVTEGDRYEVEIIDVGEQGDGVARVGPGYIVFVPNTAVGDRVTIEITQARENFGFGEVVEEEPLSS